MILHKVGYSLDTDNFDENLGALTVRKNIEQPVTIKPPKPGFLDTRPPKYQSLEEQYLDEFRRIRRVRMNMMVEKSGTRKRKRGDRKFLTVVRNRWGY
jgi:hypothetical protein